MLYGFIMMFSSAKNVLDNLEEINTIVNKSTRKKRKRKKVDSKLCLYWIGYPKTVMGQNIPVISLYWSKK